MQFRDFSDKQRQSYLESNSRINIWEGSVRAGKSVACLLRYMKELRYGVQGPALIAGRSERTVKLNVIEPLQEMTSGAIRFKSGSGEFELFGRKVYVVGANDERAEGKIRGSTFACALCDEITILPESFFRMLLSRLSLDGSRLFGTTNPDSPYHWLKTGFLDRAEELDLSVFKFRIEDNPSLSQSFIDNLKKEYKGLWYKRYIEGQWVLAEGAIYDFFDQTYHVRPRPPTYAKYYILGIDYGTSNPFAACLIGYNDDHHPSLWVEKEYFYDPKIVGHQQTDSEFANSIEREFSGYPIKLIYLDPSAESFQVELKRRRKPVVQAKNDVLDGIRFVGSLFTNGDLCVVRGCSNLIREIEGYVWDSKKVKEGYDEPLKRNDHLCDAMRYGLYSHWGKKSNLKEALSLEDMYNKSQQAQYAANPMAYPGYTNSQGWQRY